MVITKLMICLGIELYFHLRVQLVRLMVLVVEFLIVSQIVSILILKKLIYLRKEKIYIIII